MDKVIVTDRSALKDKYGPGLVSIDSKIQDLISADLARGLVTEVVSLDVAGPRMNSPLADKSQAEYKRVIDEVWQLCQHPSYLVILGGTDIIPFQELTNPVFQPPDDPDSTAPGDLPYACDAPYSMDTGDFIGPTRVIGRIPDLETAVNLNYFLSLIDVAIGWAHWSASATAAFFGLSANIWKGSTSKSLLAIFGTSAGLHTSPLEGPNWTAGQLAGLLHFINCHGALADPKFYGQSGASFPVAEDGARLPGLLLDGVTAAAECCYGATLFDPALAGGQMGICGTYLGEGGYGFFGSSTIAYGPSDDNGAADLLCQYFLEGILQGMSLGSATLAARQRFVKVAAPLSPIDLKTLAQFYLLGDASIRPVALTVSGKALPSAAAEAPRNARRRAFEAVGRALPGEVRTAMLETIEPPRDWRGLEAQWGFTVRSVRSFALREGSRDQEKARIAGDIAGDGLRRFHVLFGEDWTAQTVAPKGLTGANSRGPETHQAVLVVAESDRGTESVRKLYQR